MRTVIMLIFTVLSLLATSRVWGQEFFENRPRPPFDTEITEGDNNSILNPPSSGGPLKTPGPPPIPDPTEDDKVGGPVRDIFWIFPLLSIIYAFYKGKKVRNRKSEERRTKS